MWSRPESFGAWVRLPDATLVAVDATLAKKLGVDHSRQVGRAPRPLELHVAVTSRCPATCKGCYLDAKPDGDAPTLEALIARLTAARELGVSTVAFGGGEPLTRTDLTALGRAARGLDLLPVMTTSGIGLTKERAKELTCFAQVNVSHDGVAGGYSSVRGFDGAVHAERAIEWLSAAGVAVGVNLVLVRGSLARVEATADRIASLGARELQLLRYKPAGRAADPTYEDRRLSPDEIQKLLPLIERLGARRDLGVRIDCALVPLLGSAILERVEDAAKSLKRLGVFGCEAARSLGGLDAKGKPSPCSFMTAPDEADASTSHLAVTWDSARHLDVVRDYHVAPPEPCASCPLLSVCRGGCQVVSRHLTGGFAPDPECPRVVDYQGQ